MPRPVTSNRIEPIATAIESQRLLVIARRGEAERAGQPEVAAALATVIALLDQSLEAIEQAANIAPTPIA